MLFLFGMLGLFMINAKKLDTYLKESVELHLLFREGTKEADAAFWFHKIKESDYVKQAEFISREEAKERMENELGAGAIEILGYNPMPFSIIFNVKESYAKKDSLSAIKKELEQIDYVRELSYQADIVEQIEGNVKMIGLILLSIAFAFLIIAVALINSTVRLSMYSKRFLIKSMQLVGATRSFIRKPLMWQTIWTGLLAAGLACLAILFVIVNISAYFPQLIIVKDLIPVSALFGSVLLLGLFITTISSYFAINRYLNLRLDDLY